MKIYKYHLNWASTTLDLHQNAQVLSAQLQSDMPVLWVLCDPALPKESRRFVIYGIGDSIAIGDRNLRHLSTVQSFNGLVWHIFEDEE